MSRPVFSTSLVCLCVLLFPASALAGGPTISATPASVSRDDPGAVRLDVSGLTQPEAWLRLVVDVDGDGIVDPEDGPVWTTLVLDDVAAWSPAMPTDVDELAGQVAADVRGFGPLGFPYTAGSYIWQVQDGPGGASGTVPFTITGGGVQSVSGVVTESGAMTPIGGALVVVFPMSEECLEPTYSAITDASGAYSVTLPADLACENRLVIAAHPGFVGDFASAVPLELGGASVFTNVDLEMRTGTTSASGVVSYAGGPRDGDGVPGLLLFLESDGEGDAFGVAITDVDGSYELAVEDGDWFLEPDNVMHLNVQGAVGVENLGVAFSVSGGPVGVPEIQVPAADAFLRGVLFDDLMTAQPGRAVRADSDRSVPCDPACYRSSAITTADGSWVIGLVGGVDPDPQTYEVGAELPLSGRIARYRQADLLQADDLTGFDLTHSAPTNAITGTVHDIEGQPLGDLCLWAEGFDGADRLVVRARVDCDGTYSLPVIDGQWDIRFREDGIAGFFRGIDTSEIRDVVTIAGADEQLDLILGPFAGAPIIDEVEPAAARPGQQVVLTGTGLVSSAGAPIVMVDGVPATVLGAHAEMGRVAFEVPAGTTEGIADVMLTDPATGLSAQACLEILPGTYVPECTITGNVTRNAGTVVVEGAFVVAFNADEEVARIATTDAAGDYSLDIDNQGGPAVYDLILVPPDGLSRVWGSENGVACPGVQDHNFRTGRLFNGRVLDESGQGIANARVESGGALAFGEALTRPDGAFTMRMEEGDTVQTRVRAPRGSRFVNNVEVLTPVAGATTVPDIVLPTGGLFAGRSVGPDGTGVGGRVAARLRSNGSASGATRSDSCSGAFAIALGAEEHAIDLEPDQGSGRSSVEWVVFDGDELAEFPFPVFSEAVRQLTGPEPRIGEDSDRAGQIGQPVALLAENVPPAGTAVAFTAVAGPSKGGLSEAPGLDTIADPVRGVVLTRVPASAVSGSVVVEETGVSRSSPAPFRILPGPWDPGVFTVSGVVTHMGTPVEGAIALMFRPDPSTGGCDGDELLGDYAVTDASGAYALSFPGGSFFVQILPPRGFVARQAGGGGGTPLDLAPAAAQGFDEPGDVVGLDFDLVTGVAVTGRFGTAAAPPPTPGAAGVTLVPLPNARVFADGDVFELGLTDGDGQITFWLPPGPIDLEVLGAVGARALEAAGSFSAPIELGDVELITGAFVTGRQLDPNRDPVSGARASGFDSGGGPGGDFFERTTDLDGVWTGPVEPGVPYGVRIESRRDDVADAFFQAPSGTADDRIHYPSDAAAFAGVITGTIRDTDTATALPFLGVTAFDEDQGFPGTAIAFDQTCDDGTYRLKVATGTSYVAAFPDEISDLLSGWYSPGSGPGDLCFLDADPVMVGQGAIVAGADIDLDARSVIAGSVSSFETPAAGVFVEATQGRLGSCSAFRFTSPGGGYAIEVPASPEGYRVESQAPITIGGPSQCWQGQTGCETFTPVTTMPLETTSGIDFIFGFSPSEISGAEPRLRVERAGGASVRVTFEKKSPAARADVFNVYGGLFGDFGHGFDAMCHIDPIDLMDNGDGTYSYTYAPSANVSWFLVSASNVVGEGTLGGEMRSLDNACGPLILSSSGVSQAALPERQVTAPARPRRVRAPGNAFRLDRRHSASER